MSCCRDSIGDSTISGDLRWGGTLGVSVDFVARSHCSVEFIPLEDIQVYPIYVIPTDHAEYLLPFIEIIVMMARNDRIFKMS